MKQVGKLLVVIGLFVAGVASTYATTMSPVGRWKTIDDTTGKARSIVQISQQQGVLQGRILKVFLRKGEKKTDVCKECTGKFENKPILGMTFLWGMKKVGQNLWKNGRVLDPSNGKIYRAEFSLGKQGKTLLVRGYIGLPLFGRTQTWIRVPSKGKA